MNSLDTPTRRTAPLSRFSPDIRAKILRNIEREEERSFLLANRVHRAMAMADLHSEDGYEILPESPGITGSHKRGQIYRLGDDELSVHLSNLGHKNLANGFAADPVKSLSNILALSNEERFTASYFSTPLTAYTVGWTDPEDLESLVEFIAPKVPVNRRFEYKLAINKEAFYSEIEDERTIGGDFPQVEYKGQTNYSKTLNRGLKYRIDLDEEGAGIINEQLIVGRLLQRCRRNQWRRAVSALTTFTGALTTPAPVAKVWTNTGQTPAPQPAEDIRTLIQTVQQAAGVWPNRLIMDLLSWNLIKKSYAAQLTAGAIAMYDMTVDDLVADQQIEGAMVAKAIYTSAAGNQQNLIGTKSYIYPQKVIAFYGQSNPGLDDPSTLKRFVTPAGDGDFRVYRQQVGAKFVDISVEYYENTLNTASVGAGELDPS